MVDMPPVPPAVVELVPKQDIEHKFSYYGQWKDYSVYQLNFPELEEEGTEWGLPSLILYKEGKARNATVNEQDAILFNIEMED